jgi:hypothetical protein
MAEDIYISFVVTGRNDNYGGDFLYRMNLFLKVLLHFLNKYNISAELVVVEWNPPPTNPLLKDVLAFPQYSKNIPIRFILVPHEIHTNFPNSEKMPLFEYIAKNTGIRRAKGKYILVTNPDIIFTQQLMLYFSYKNLSPDCFYRAIRHDFNIKIPLEKSVTDIIYLAKKNIYIIHYPHGSKKINWLKKWYLTLYFNILEKNNHFSLSPNSFIILNDRIHTNASGDFILTSKDNWHKINGFPEYTDTFTHLDSYACYQLKAAGLNQIVFNYPLIILHCDHDRSEQKTRPKNEKWEIELEMIKEGKLGPAINGANWGLANYNLEEHILYV